ncbi:toxin [Candidatus Nomurabacteria bacterium]|nr:toxin [Candidatus Nomurabacteria bacterium]
MKSWSWKPEKNKKLLKMGRPCFEDVLQAIDKGGFRDVLSNPHYPDQNILIVIINDYAHAVPFKETEEVFFLFTVYPSRAYKKQYGGKRK